MQGAYRRLKVLSDWMEEHDLKFGRSTCGTTAYLIDEDNDVVGLTRDVDDALLEGEDLRAQCEGVWSLMQVGYGVGFHADDDLPEWQPGTLELTILDKPVYIVEGAATWTEAVKDALRWAFHDRLMTGDLEAMEVG